MKLSLAWLRDHLDGDADADVLAERLTAAGLNVELREKDGDDEVWDVDVTTNRPDAMNHRGLAREAAAAGVAALRPLRGAVTESGPPAASSATVTVEDEHGCPRYCARVIRGVTVGPSPAWLAERVERCGMRSINNVVDATNYVLLDLGQPLHAFDLATLGGAEIRVRRARAGERLETLDGVQRVLDPADLVIADADRAVGLAGVMGGADTEISERTTDILLESAYFDALTVRRTARRLGLKTEASHRFERGADRAIAAAAADACAALIADLTGGTVAPGLLDTAPSLPEPAAIAVSLDRLDAFTGTAVPRDLVARVFAALGFEPRADGATLVCTVPSWRVDLERPEDLYEEALRHYGYDRIPSAPLDVAAVPGRRLGGWLGGARARRALTSVGAAEAVTYSFVGADVEGLTAATPLADRGDAVELENPISARLAVLRRSVLAGLAEAAAGNLRRGAESVLLGEVGRVFFADGDGVREENRLALAMAGAVGPWDARRGADFLDLKGAVEDILADLGAAIVAWRPASTPLLAEGDRAELVADGRVVGIAGRLSDAAADHFALPEALWVAELDLAVAPSAPTPSFVPVPRFPAVVADLTVRHDHALSYASLVEAIVAAGPAWLEDVAPVVRYRGEGVAAGEVKTTVRITYRNPDRSLTQDEVNDAHFALMEQLRSTLGVSYS